MEAEVVRTDSKVEMDEAQKLYQEYLQRCCEVGQLRHQLDQLDSQKKEIEKNLDITERKVRSISQQHRDVQKVLATKVQMPKQEESKEAH